MKNQLKIKSAAIITIFDADSMSKAGKKAIANWLRQNAKDLEKLGHKYAKRMSARYYYRESLKK